MGLRSSLNFWPHSYGRVTGISLAVERKMEE
jgi:hypothetical protein